MIIIEEKLISIYKITNIKDNIIYIGQTSKDVRERFLEHFRMATRVNNGMVKSENSMYKDMALYEKSDFKIETIDTCSERHKYIIESYWTEKFKVDNKIYNINSGSSISEKQKLAQKEINRKNAAVYKTEEYRNKLSTLTSGENNGMYGMKYEKAPNGRAVFMCDKNWNIVKKFSSVKCALKYLGITGHVMLLRCCKNKTEYKGYYWTKEWINR